MANITATELITKLNSVGLIDLAREVELAAEVSISDYAHFAIYDKNGYGDEFVAESTDSTIVVYGRIVEPEGGTVWQFRDNPDYEVLLDDTWVVTDGEHYMRIAKEFKDKTSAKYCRDVSASMDKVGCHTYGICKKSQLVECDNMPGYYVAK